MTKLASIVKSSEKVGMAEAAKMATMAKMT